MPDSELKRRFARQTQPRTSPRPGPAAGLVIAYHRIAQLTPDTHRLCISPSTFREHVQFLRHHCSVMPLVDLVFAARAASLPHNAVAVTLDDGYLDALTTAAPILEAEGVPATFFVNTERLHFEHESWQDVVEEIFLGGSKLPEVLDLPYRGNILHYELTTAEKRQAAVIRLHEALVPASHEERAYVLNQLQAWSGRALPARPERRLLVAEEVQALARIPGCAIGSHSAHHLLMPQHDAVVQHNEVVSAKRELESLLDAPVIGFAYPFGAYDPRVTEAVRAASHRVAVTVEPGLVTSEVDPLRIPRLEVPNVDSRAFEQWIRTQLAANVSTVSQSMAVVQAHAGQQGAVEQEPDRCWVENDHRSREEHARGETRLTARPQFLIIDPSSRCNARCVMCPVSFRAPGDSGEDLASAIFDKLAPLIPTASQVNLFSSGEPTIAKDIVSLLQQARRRRSHHTALWMSTNGKHLPVAVVEQLMAPGAGLQFSVDGTSETFEAIRRGIKFDQLCRSLALAQQLRGALSYPALSFSSTISKRNIHDLANIFALAQRNGVEHIYFYEEDPEVEEEEQFALDETDRPTFEAQLDRIHQTGVGYSNGLYFRGANGLRAVNPEPPATPPAIHCSAPWKVFHQRADGTVRTCCTLRQSMGDLRHQSFEEVWNGEEYVKLRRAFVDQSGIPATCYRCTDPLRTWGSNGPRSQS